MGLIYCIYYLHYLCNISKVTNDQHYFEIDISWKSRSRNEALNQNVKNSKIDFEYTAYHMH